MGIKILFPQNIPPHLMTLFSPSDVHLHMLASEKVGQVTWP
jgi:hypothetical protein